ncbi:glycosyltransferase [Sphingomonas turrisvirgatae]|uniref:Glycoside hydrolase n=1 Tax=Sphingomonas turrisvirgatae TaxID=1888892 RepID=A0A1E3M0B1_9SPHN|nr:glycosyltransferase [Sphingomonas turrisvirgatae]ODP39444.1 glycoside hydrolase [Sphingomonas turrisvirgatae]
MLRVLTLSSLYPDASRPNFGVFVERQTLGLATHWDVELQVVAPVGLPPWPFHAAGHYRALGKLPPHEAWKGVPTWRPPFTVLPGTAGRFHVPLLVRRLTPLLNRIRADFPFDVIDASFFFPDGVAAIALGRRFGVPVSIKARGADIHLWGNAPATRHQVAAGGRAADGLLCVSQAMKADMIALGMPPERIRVHHTGVDLTRFAPGDQAAAKAGLGIQGPLVASIGALIPRKGHDIVIDAVARLPGVSLRIAGEGPERQRLAAQIVSLGVADRVKLLGSVAHDELPPLLAAADVMALASASEGLANAWVEALASGAPLVTSDAGGAREVVTAPQAGRVVARDPAAFAAAIAELLAAPPPRAAVRRMAAGFTWEANTAALYDHLRGLVAAHASA